MTTQNLAGVFSIVEVRSALKPRARELAENTFGWLLGELAGNRPDHHSQLIAIKNAACAWRQMLFYLSQLSATEMNEFFGVMERQLAKHAPASAERFRPAITGMRNVHVGDDIAARGGKRLLGWTTSGHWLMEKA